MLRVIIAGSRNFDDYELLKNTMADVLRNEENGVVVVCGEARGADTLGRQYAEEMGFEIDSHPAEWDKYHKRAGFVRNVDMVNCADALVAFWDGSSRGTKHIIDTARKRELRITVVRY